MSSLSWDFPSSSTNPMVDGDDDDIPEGASDDQDGNGSVDLMEQEAAEREELEALERELLEQLGGEQNGASAREQIEALEQEERREELEREQVEDIEREQVEQEQDGRAEIDALAREEREEREQLEALEREQLAQLAQLEGAGFALAEESGQSERGQSERGQSEREQLEALERQQLEALARPQDPEVAAAPKRQSRARSAERPRPATPPPAGPSAAVPDAEDLAAQFLASVNQRRAADEAGYAPGPATELREASEPARAARAIVEHRHRNLVEANVLLTEARRVLAPMAYRGLSDRAYRRRKIILGIGEAVSLAIAFSAAFDVAPLEGLLLSGAIALAFVIAGDLGGVLRLTAERSRLSAALEDDVVHLDPRYLHILYHSQQPWLSIIG
ncbi:MAG: hypothetical protein QOE93_1806, partial [Actinomycetota bacterium]|nr:hypothetical protein [Actinomycetota bacterium]